MVNFAQAVINAIKKAEIYPNPNPNQYFGPTSMPIPKENLMPRPLKVTENKLNYQQISDILKKLLPKTNKKMPKPTATLLPANTKPKILLIPEPPNSITNILANTIRRQYGR